MKELYNDFVRYVDNMSHEDMLNSLRKAAEHSAD